jgi:cobalt-zinc-cadmium efflux system membrane fusion protein
LATVHEGQEITITVGAGDESSPATIMFVSPLLDKDTRFARVVASVDNAARKWRPGAFITAEIPTDEAPAVVVVPKTALQSIKGDTIIFVRTADGFEARKVDVGRQDARLAEVTNGLVVGERVATTNTFILKADLGKAEAEHED